MFEVVYYEDKPGVSSLYNQIAELAEKADTNKNIRIQYNQIAYLIKLLRIDGTKLISKYTKPISENI